MHYISNMNAGKEFQWAIAKGRTLSGTAAQIGKIIQSSLESFTQKIPSVLMHRLWKRDGLDYFRKVIC